MTVCPGCDKSFRRIKAPYCFVCGRSVQDSETEICGECLKRGHHYRNGIAVFEYDSVMKRAMSDFKFNGWKENAEFFVGEAVRLHGDRLNTLNPDALVPVPIHRSKLAARGYNQAQVLAEGIGRLLGIPVISDFLIRSRKTAAQKALGRESRQDNIRRAFECDMTKYNSDYIGTQLVRIALIDDIFTTGTTMENCTLALMRAGVKEVIPVSIAIGSGI